MNLKNLAEEFNLFGKKNQYFGIEGGFEKKYFRIFLEKTIRNFDFVIEKSPRKYSDQYLN
jgi:hypothetical protein